MTRMLKRLSVFCLLGLAGLAGSSFTPAQSADHNNQLCCLKPGGGGPGLMPVEQCMKIRGRQVPRAQCNPPGVGNKECCHYKGQYRMHVRKRCAKLGGHIHPDRHCRRPPATHTPTPGRTLADEPVTTGRNSICCHHNGRYQKRARSQCRRIGGHVHPDRHCSRPPATHAPTPESVCCHHKGRYQKRARSQCRRIGGHVHPDRHCSRPPATHAPTPESVCCHHKGRYQKRARSQCRRIGGHVHPDRHCKS